MADTEAPSTQLVPATDNPSRAVEGAALTAPERSQAIRKQSPRNPNRAYIRVQMAPNGSQTYVMKPEGYAATREASANGKALASIARQVLNISPEAYEDMRKRDPLAQECVEVGRALMSDELHDLLMESARSGNTVAQIFLARSRAGWNNDAGAIEGMPQPKVINNTQINISLVEPLTPEQFKQITQGAQSLATNAISTSGADVPPDREHR